MAVLLKHNVEELENILLEPGILCSDVVFVG